MESYWAGLSEFQRAMVDRHLQCSWGWEGEFKKKDAKLK